MTDRERHIVEFLKAAGWGDAARAPLAGDASFRTYERLRRGTATRVFMDAPPPMEDTVPFIAIDTAFRSQGYSAPEILAADTKRGFLLLEDLGDDLFTHMIGKAGEEVLYAAAVDLLVDLQSRPVADDVTADFGVTYRIPAYSEALLLEEARLLTDWYIPNVAGEPLAAAAIEEFDRIWRELLARARHGGDCLVHRDYHADNLVWLPDRESHARVGLLDFQDAVIGPPAYDLVSLLEDARRDVSEGVVEAMLDRYCDLKVDDAAAFRMSYDILGAQRNTKIIGIFTRLYRRDGKQGYLKLIPRVWRLLEADVDRPALAPYRAWLDRHVPTEIRGVPS